MKILRYLTLSLCLALISPSPNPESFEKHAVIMSGDSDFRHPKSISLADSILSNNNYNTYIFDDTKNRKYNVTGLTTKKNLERFFDTLKTDNNDLFLLYVTGHGNRDTTKNDTASIIKMPDGKLLKPSTLEKYLNNVNASKRVLLFTQCYSGGFSKRLGKWNNIAISTSSATKPAYGTFFGDNFFKSIDNKNADTNNDDKIYVLESASYATSNDIFNPIPLNDSYSLSKKREKSNFIIGFPFYNEPKINYENSNPREVYLNKLK